MHSTPQWIKEYVRHNAFSMTAKELIEALQISQASLSTIASEVGVQCRKEGDEVNTFIMRSSSGNSTAHLSALSLLTELRRMALMGHTVEQIAAALMLSTSTVHAKLKEHLLPIRWNDKAPNVSNINIFIVANHQTMFIEDIAKHLRRSRMWINDRMKTLGLEGKWKPADQAATKRLVKPIGVKAARIKYIKDHCKTTFIEDMAGHLDCNIYSLATTIRKMGYTPLWKTKPKAGNIKHSDPILKEDQPKPFTRPPAVYSNTTPYGIAKEIFNNSNQYT